MVSRPTLASLAEQLGVSRQTVSNAINAPERVRPVTLERVRELISASGYRPNSAARQLRTRRSRNLGFRLFPSEDGINGAVMDRFLHALTERLQEYDYRVTIFAAPDVDAEIETYGELLETSDLDGFILTDTRQDDPRTGWLMDRGVPFVTLGRPWSSDDGACPYPWVDIDGSAGTAEATNYLLEKGHRRIGFLGWPEGHETGRDRHAGWQTALSPYLGARELDSLSVGVADGIREGAAGALTLLANGATAVVCASDSLALGASEQFRAAFPDRPPAVIGFDDTPVAAAVGMSSISQPVEDAAGKIVEIMRTMLDDSPNPTKPPRHLLLPPRLVLRDGGGLLASPSAA
ncbi:LacI family DNA-binding transcriptional regulator [Pseudarthrobacter sp. P1]|uniref:LacI family DNA-binding transcriptional regulator n=1 Tax=Pseudarthrobacter sp. P1 TaxID=3418418 RepID=UPI003CF7695C